MKIEIPEYALVLLVGASGLGNAQDGCRTVLLQPNLGARGTLRTRYSGNSPAGWMGSDRRGLRCSKRLCTSRNGRNIDASTIWVCFS